MTNLGAPVSESTVNTLARRTTRLVELVERATQASPAKEIREGGKQLVELLNERMEEIRELHSMDDEELGEKVRAFTLRLKLAEEKVLSWKHPAKPRKPPVAKTASGRSTSRGQKGVKSAA